MQLRSRLEKSVGAAGSQKDNSPLVDRILALKDDLKALSQDEDFLLSQLGSRPVSKDPLVLGGETEREKLIRTGKITPFASMVSKDEQMGAAASSSTHAPTENDDLGMEWTDEEEIVNKQDNKADSEDTDEDEGISTGILPSSREDRYVDDGNEPSYQRRLQRWAKERFTKRLAKLRRQGDSFDNEGSFNAEEELFRPSPTHPDINIAPGFNLPGDVHHRLFEYQRTCIKWLWELHCQEVGGILGDEMGLGKTIQVIAFLAGLSHSRKLRGPVLVVCPATVMKQWVQEFHEWWPPLRVAVLHSSGSGMMGGSSSKFTSRTDGKEWYSEEDDDSFSGPQKSTKRVYKSNSAIHKFLSFIVQNGGFYDMYENKGSFSLYTNSGHVVITTYEGLRVHRADLLPIKWTYTVLDEGHKIRNPDAEITMAAKQLKTHNRIILSGTPIQNNLTELWSLYDFVFPGRLGTLPVFQSEFSIPISLGGYANATVVQVQTAYKCATVLRDLISPYLLRRLKSDVASSLPKKSEQVLFCKLTNFQKREYEKFLGSEEVEGILHGKRHALYGIDILRKICNHRRSFKFSNDFQIFSSDYSRSIKSK